MRQTGDTKSLLGDDFAVIISGRGAQGTLPPGSLCSLTCEAIGASGGRQRVPRISAARALRPVSSAGRALAE